MTELATFVRACALSDLPDEGVIGVDINGVPVAIVRAQGQVFALRDVCSHAEVALSEGEVYDYTIELCLPGSCFDLRTRNPTGPPSPATVPPSQTKPDAAD